MHPEMTENTETQDTRTRVMIVSSIDISLLRFRGKLIELLIESNYEVFLVAPEYSSDTEAKLKELGAQTLRVPMSRSGMSVVHDWRTYKNLKTIMKEKSIDLVFPYTIKPVMYASLAARQLGIPVVGLVNGLGYVFTGDSMRQKLLRKIIGPVYKYSVALNKAMVFQNIDDREFYENKKLVANHTKLVVVSGSGVDLEEFKWREPRGDKNLRFGFVGRLIVEKGIFMYLEAASRIKKEWPQAEFHVFGEVQPGSPNSISMEAIQSSIDVGDIKFHGRVKNIADELRKLDVIVCPSWYREGIPRSLLEALSVGLAVIATDTPGCRETVEHNENGWLIEPKSQEQLTRAIEDAIKDSSKVEQMCYRSREKAVERFDVHIVNAQLLAVFQEAIAG